MEEGFGWGVWGFDPRACRGGFAFGFILRLVLVKACLLIGIEAVLNTE